MFYPVNCTELKLLSHQLAKKIKQTENNFNVIVAIARGGLSVANLLSYILDLPVTTISVSTYTGMKKQNTPHIEYGAAKEVEGCNVLLVDDVADSGETLSFCQNYLKKHKVASLSLATLFYKPSSTVKPDFFVKQTKDWVVFPYEFPEMTNIYHEMKSTDTTKAEQLKQALLKLKLPQQITEGKL